MRGGESNGRHARHTGHPPDQHRQPQAGIPSTQDELAQPVQACDAESVGDRRGGVSECAAECDPGGDYLYPAGGADLKEGEDDDRKCMGTEVSDDAECGPC